MFQHFYYKGRNGVDENNKERQGFLAFEDVYRPKDWNRRQFGAVIGLVLANAHMGYEYFVNKPSLDGKRESKASYLRVVAEDLVLRYMEEKIKRGQAVAVAAPDQEDNRDVLDSPCAIVTIPPGHYKWDAVEECFPKGKEGSTTVYNRYKCTGKSANGLLCGKRVRTFCVCNRGVMLCPEHYAVHCVNREGS